MKQEKNIFDYIKRKEQENLSTDFFENLSATIIKQHPQQTTKIVPIHKKKIHWILSVASVAAIVLFMVIWNENKTVKLKITEQPTQEELLAYVNENIDDFDEDLFVELIHDQKEQHLHSKDFSNKEGQKEKSKKQKEAEFKEVQFEKLNKEEILDYLRDEELNIQDLENTIDETF